MLFKLAFANNTIFSCFSFFFLIIDLYFIIPKVIAQIFNPSAELAIPIGIPAKEAREERAIHRKIAEIKIRKWSI